MCDLCPATHPIGKAIKNGNVAGSFGIHFEDDEKDKDT